MAEQSQFLTGEDIRCLMRKNKLTLRDIATRGHLKLKRVREVRKDGVRGAGYVQDWFELLLPKS